MLACILLDYLIFNCYIQIILPSFPHPSIIKNIFLRGELRALSKDRAAAGSANAPSRANQLLFQPFRHYRDVHPLNAISQVKAGGSREPHGETRSYR